MPADRNYDKLADNYLAFVQLASRVVVSRGERLLSRWSPNAVLVSQDETSKQTPKRSLPAGCQGQTTSRKPPDAVYRGSLCLGPLPLRTGRQALAGVSSVKWRGGTHSMLTGRRSWAR